MQGYPEECDFSDDIKLQCIRRCFGLYLLNKYNVLYCMVKPPLPLEIMEGKAHHSPHQVYISYTYMEKVVARSVSLHLHARAQAT